MDNQQKEALRQSRPFLVDNLIVDDLWDYLIEQDIFSTVMLEQIMAKETSLDKIIALVDTLIRRDSSAFEKFLTALNDSGHKHCADTIHLKYIQLVPRLGAND